MNSAALFSADRKYRYMLTRTWNEDKPRLVFIGLNPSTANETENDATIRRVIRFAWDFGYGGCIMTNLFAYVSTDPRALLIVDDPVGPQNDQMLKTAAEGNDVLFAWGNFNVGGRDLEVIKMFPNAFCLGKNKNGSPKHPLYIKAATPLIKF